MRYWGDLILHFLSSNSRHGTHSPFVYKLADEVIYSRQGVLKSTKLSKSERLMNELIVFFRKDLGVEALILDIMKSPMDEILLQHNNMPIIILKNIYSTNATKMKWKSIQKNQSVLVTIDLFYFAVLIRRKEQPKENFKLRFPFFKY